MLPDFEAITVQGGPLKGWKPITVWGPPGSSVDILGSQKVVVDVGPFQDTQLAVYVQITAPTGQTLRQMRITQRADRVSLTTLEEVGAYVKGLAPGGDLAELEAELHAAIDKDMQTLLRRDWKLGKGPAFGPGEIFGLITLNEEMTSLDPENPAPSHGQLRRIMNAAYSLGREVREAEIPGDVARSAATASGLRRSAKAEAWWDEGATWAQGMLDRYPIGWRAKRRRGINGLANEIADHWDTRPFAPRGPADAPDVMYLNKHVLPTWRARGLLKLP